MERGGRLMLLRDVIGHEEIIKTLKGALSSGRVAHAYLFSGPPGVGKMTTAQAFAGALVCERPASGDACGDCSSCARAAQGIHPDVRLIRPEGATVKIGQLREMAAGIQFGPATGRWTVRIVDEADTMTAEAANSLLKTLEEPHPGVVIILVTSRPRAMLPTIISRCQHLYFQPLLKKQLVQGMIRFGGAADNLELAASLAGGSLGRAVELLAGGLSVRNRACEIIRRLAGAGVQDVLTMAGSVSAGREQIIPLLELMILWFRDMLLYNVTGAGTHLINSDRDDEIRDLAGHYSTGRLLEIIPEIERVKNSLAASANVQLAMESLFLYLSGKGDGNTGPEEVDW